MLRLCQQRPAAALLHDFPVAHHQHAIRQLGDHRQIVADQQQRVAVATALRQQLQDLPLHRHIQRRGRLIGNQQRRTGRQRGGDQGALALPAGKLVRVACQTAFRVANARGLQ